MKSRIFKPPQGEVSTKDINNIIDSQKNVANGIAGLDSNALINLSNLPLIPSSQLDFSFVWEKVAEVSSTGAASVNITGLDGDVDKLYMLIIDWTNLATSTQILYAQCNSDTAVGNYMQGGLGITTSGGAGASLQRFGSTSGISGMRFLHSGGGNTAVFGIVFINAQGITVGTKTYILTSSINITTAGSGDRVCFGGWIKSANLSTLSLFTGGGTSFDVNVKIFKPKW